MKIPRGATVPDVAIEFVSVVIGPHSWLERSSLSSVLLADLTFDTMWTDSLLFQSLKNSNTSDRCR